MLPSSDTPTPCPAGLSGPPPPLSPSRWSKARSHHAFRRYAALSLIGGLCAFTAPLWPFSDSYLRLLLDLASHFIWGYLGLALLILAVSKGKARWVALVAVLVNAALLANAYRSSETPAMVSIAKQSLPVMSANVHVHNEAPEKLVHLLAENQPALVFVQEVSPAWAAVLEKLPAYPYRKIVARRDSFGIALLSKYPLEDVTVVEEGEFDVPAISATLTWKGTKVAVRAVHPYPPIKAQAYVDRNRMLANHAEALVATRLPAIMAGDFNATPWSTGVSVVQDAGMVRATSMAPTWPASVAVPAVIPIDHITVSRHWGVLSNGRGPNIGSDHYPVMATLYLR